MPLRSEHALPAFDKYAREIGYQIDSLADGLVIHLIGGDPFVPPDGAQHIRNRLVAPEKVMLQLLRDNVTEEIAKTANVLEGLGQRAVG